MCQEELTDQPLSSISPVIVTFDLLLETAAGRNFAAMVSIPSLPPKADPEENPLTFICCLAGELTVIVS